MNLLIHNVLIFTNDNQNRVLHNHAVAIEGTRICEIGPEAEMKAKYPHFQKFDGGGGEGTDAIARGSGSRS
jgi:cytosine/adenosine deaminase-related metal-dependent hydrolase